LARRDSRRRASSSAARISAREIGSVLTSAPVASRIAFAIALLGKSDSETQFRLLTRGRTPAGRDKVRLQWEVKPLGTPFSATGLGISTVRDTGAPTGTGSTTDFNELVSGLGEGGSYRWRLRVVSSNPFFPASPWWSLQGDGITETKLRMSGCVDHDGDGYGASGDASCLSGVADCNDADPSMWATPGPTTNLRFTSGKTMLGWNGDGHTAYGEGSACVDTIVNAYLISLKVPRSGTVCG
jgi:hypothetical protein